MNDHESLYTHGDEFGHEKEDQLFKALQLLQVSEVPRDKVGEKLNGLAYSKGTDEDDRGGVDFFFYSPKSGWQRLDLTTSVDPAVIARKKDKAKSNGVKLLQLPPWMIERASLGGTDYLDQISTKLAELALEK